MAMIYGPRELAVDGRGINRWRMVGTSDEDSTIFRELCRCLNGHVSPGAAVRCSEAREFLGRKFPKAPRKAALDVTVNVEGLESVAAKFEEAKIVIEALRAELAAVEAERDEFAGRLRADQGGLGL